MAYFLRFQSDELEQAEKHETKSDALQAFDKVARELDNYGQRMEASLHVAATLDEVAEYPDFVLSLGPRGGLRCERA